MSYDAECASQRQMQASHIANGWGDIGQHFTVFQSGRIFRGRPEDVRGVHAPVANVDSFGIEHQGNFTETLPLPEQWAASVTLCAYLCRTYRIDPASILGHRDVTATACPGNRMYPELPRFREDVRRAMSGGEAIVIEEDEMSDSMSGGWLQPGESDFIDFDTGVGNPAGGSKNAAYNTYVKARTKTGKVQLRCEVRVMDFVNKPDHPYYVGSFDLVGTDDSSFVPEQGVRQFLASKGFDPNGFYAGHLTVTNMGATAAKVWRVRYVSAG